MPFSSRVAIHSADDDLESTGLGMDGPLAAWDALCKLEQLLREARARRGSDASIAPGTSTPRHVAMMDAGGAT